MTKKGANKKATFRRLISLRDYLIILALAEEGADFDEDKFDNMLQERFSIEDLVKVEKRVFSIPTDRTHAIDYMNKIHGGSSCKTTLLGIPSSKSIKQGV